MKNRLGLMILGLAFITSMAAAEADDSGFQSILDMDGRSVSVPKPLTRAIATGGALDAWFLMLGAMDKLVGTSSQLEQNRWFAKIYPGIGKIPAVFSSGDVESELLRMVQPQAALLFSGVPSRMKIEKSGIPVIILERDNPQQIEDAIEIAGKVLGPKEEKIAHEFREYYDLNMKRVTDRTSVLPREGLKRVYYAGTTPFTTEGGHTIVSSWIEMAGGVNAAEKAGVVGINQTISLEEIIRWNPEVIITFLPAVRDQIANDPRWRLVSAVQKGRIYVNPRGVYPWCTRSAEEALQVLWAAKTIHPELFQDLSIEKETKDFHERFYHYKLTDQDIVRMLNAEAPE